MSLTVLCPWCGGKMDFKIIHLGEQAYCYDCPTCIAHSPITIGKPQEETIRRAQAFTLFDPHLFEEDQFQSGDLIPTVIWAELKGDEPVAGVWTGEFYEMETGGVMDSPAEEIREKPGQYNVSFRFWDKCPDKRQREEHKWKESSR